MREAAVGMTVTSFHLVYCIRYSQTGLHDSYMLVQASLKQQRVHWPGKSYALESSNSEVHRDAVPRRHL